MPWQLVSSAHGSMAAGYQPPVKRLTHLKSRREGGWQSSTNFVVLCLLFTRTPLPLPLPSITNSSPALSSTLNYTHLSPSSILHFLHPPSPPFHYKHLSLSPFLHPLLLTTLPLPLLHTTLPLLHYKQPSLLLSLLLQPLLSPVELEKTKAAVTEFGRRGGDGEKLQEKLLERAKTHDNWVGSFVWHHLWR